jgi:hypothetical protein
MQLSVPSGSYEIFASVLSLFLFLAVRYISQICWEMEFYYSVAHPPPPPGTKVPEASRISSRYMISTEECCASDNTTSMGDDKISPTPSGGGR